MPIADPTLLQVSTSVRPVDQHTEKANSKGHMSHLAQSLTYPGQRFVYTSLDGELVTVPSCIYENRYIFDPEHFAQVSYPFTWPPGRPWPPQCMEDLCCTSDFDIETCSPCDQSFEDWRSSTEQWNTRFELRETQDRGIGVFTKKSIRRLEILGWYTGEVSPNGLMKSDYRLSLPIGSASRSEIEKKLGNLDGDHLSLDWYTNICEEVVIVDAGACGNWTRFINHSCSSNTAFKTLRKADTIIMAIKAKRDIAPNVELTLDYGDVYFERKTCLCGAVDCVEKKKKRMKEELLEQDREIEKLTGELKDAVARRDKVIEELDRLQSEAEVQS